MVAEGPGPGGTSLNQVIAKATAAGCKMVDLRFVDMPGAWHHFSVPLSDITEEFLARGVGFDGSSIRGFKEIHESDMLLIPDPASAVVDPTLKVPTLCMVCNVRDPMDPRGKKGYARDPRRIAQRAEEYLRDSHDGAVSKWGPEVEFYIFRSIRFDQNEHSGYYFIDSDEGIWNSGAGEAPNLGFRPHLKEGYAKVPPTDTLQDVRSDITLKLIEAGVGVEVHHHEVGTAGQAEINMCYTTLTRMADAVLMCKYIAKNVSREHGYVATFMPKPLFRDNGSGMHCHQSLWHGEHNLFFDEKGYAQLSQMAIRYIGGLLKHAPALLAFCAPSTNSYRRLVPGYEAPINLAYSQRNRSACVRIPAYSTAQEATRIEFRPPDATCNPYLAFAAMLMAGIDGILSKIEPPDPVHSDLYTMSAAEKARLGIKKLPGSLADVLRQLEDDKHFLLRGGVFTEEFIDAWIEHKWTHDVEEVNLPPHPREFYLYHDV